MNQQTRYTNPFRVHPFIASFCIALFAICALIAGVKVLTHHTPASGTAVTFVPQPPSAAQVAKSMNCGRFTDLPVKPGTGLGTVDGGTCWIGNAKYAINTFPTTAVRDSWLTAAEPFGVNPKWETATAVIYPNVPSS